MSGGYSTGGSGGGGGVAEGTVMTGAQPYSFVFTNSASELHTDNAGVQWTGASANIPSLEGITLTSGPTYTLLEQDNTLYCLATTTVTLPAISRDGKCYTIINGDGSGSTTVTFVASGGATIAGDFQGLSTRPYEGCKFMSDLANNVWRPVVNIPSSLYIGNTVVGAGSSQVLFTDTGGYLSSSTSFVYDGQALSLPPGVLANPGLRFTSSSGMMEESTNVISLIANSLRSATYTDTTFTFFPDGPSPVVVDYTTGLTATNANYLYDTAGTPALSADGVNRILYNTDGTSVAVDWAQGALVTAGATSIDWGSRILNGGSGAAGNGRIISYQGETTNQTSAAYWFDSNNANRIMGDGSGLTGVIATTATNSNYLYDTAGSPLLAADGVNRTLYASDGTTVTLNWNNRNTIDSASNQSIDWENRTLTDTDGASVSIRWDTKVLKNSGATALDWASRYLYDTAGTGIVIDWHTDTSNVASANYWFDSANGNRITGDGSGLTGISSSPTIGSPVSGGTANCILFIDGSGNLAQQPGDFEWDGTKLTIQDLSATGGFSSFAAENDFAGEIYAEGFHYSSDGTSGGTLGPILNSQLTTAAGLDLTITASTDATTGQNIYITAPDGATTDGFVRIAGGNDAGNGYVQIYGPRIAFFGVSPVNIQSVTGPSGGTVQDSEARTAIAALITAFQNYGLLA